MKALYVAPLLAAFLIGCPDDSVKPIADAGDLPAVDAATPPPACDSPEDCKAAGFDGVCRQGLCASDVPCGDDAECGLGESCVSGQCRFTGCVADGDCAVGKCRKDVFACTECSKNDDCPDSSPVCTEAGHCVRCGSDADCGYPGAPYCDVPSGACVYCKEDAHCPNGLHCGANGVCQGAQKKASCNMGIACDLGLMCVKVGGGASVCLEACNLYSPKCTNGEICSKVTFEGSPSLVFDEGAPLGICSPPYQGLRGYHEPCNSNCEPNLECVPDTPTDKSCKAYCDPLAPFCANGEKCHSLPGDYAGHEYGLCYPNNGVHDACTADRDCKSGLACVPRDDPSTTTELSTACEFAVGTKPLLAPCTQDSECQSNACRNDPAQGPGKFFCFGACDEDADCSANGRTGLCDTPQNFTTQYVLTPGAPVTGCRPACSAPADCASYGPSANPYTCVAYANPKKARYDEVCGPPRGTKLSGESCSADYDCADGLCLQKDGRGNVFRDGVCSHPCTQNTDCAPNPPGVATSCEKTAVLFANGNDGTPYTLDDVVGSAALCSGSACGANADCAAPFSVCTADRDPLNANGNLITACRAPTFSGTLQAGDSCTQDAQCATGVCAYVGLSTTVRTCLQPCKTAASDCGGTLTCTANGVRVKRPDGTFQAFDACVP